MEDEVPTPSIPSFPAADRGLTGRLEAGVQLGDFRIERRIGAGGMGVVYLARQVSLDRPVALKVLGSALGREADKARFRREAQAVAKLHHPAVAAVYFVGQDEQVCYMAMEYVDGPSLRSLLGRIAATREPGLTFDDALRRDVGGDGDARPERFDEPTATHSPPPEAEGDRVEPGSPTPEARRLAASPAYVRRCCEVVREAALGLAHAHDRGVVHRDVKPENLMLDRAGGVHVIDFGIARFFEDVTLTNTGALVGTPMYMSPEQVTGRLGVDHRTDIYSLGLVFYELLALRRPIVAATREGILRQIVTKELVPITWRNPAVDRGLEGVVHKATAKDPDDRYPTASRLAADLGDFLAGKPVAAHPYRYRFDEGEIAAARPREVVTVASLFFMLGILFAIAAVISALVLYDRMTSTVALNPHYQSVDAILRNVLTTSCLLLITLACGLGGSGLLTGRGWAMKLVGANTAAIPLFLLAFVASGGVTGSQAVSVAVAVTVVLLVVVIPVRGRRTRDWFRLAAQLRSEQEQQAAACC